ncbi:MAG: hypothetical protein QM831_45185 [Kofleriaceae bacterium]
MPRLHDPNLRPNLLCSSIALISVALASVASRAHADDADADGLFKDGDRLMAVGKIDEACSAFEASNKLDPRAGTLIRLGECREQAGQLATALTAFRSALARVKDPAKKKRAIDHVASLEPRLSTLRIVPTRRIPGLTITRDGALVEPAAWDSAQPIDGGTYLVVASAPGYVEERTTVSVPKALGAVTARIPELHPIPVAMPEVEVVEAPATEPTPVFTTRRKIALAIGAVGAAAIVGGIVLGEGVQDSVHAAYALCPDPATPCANAAEARADLADARSHALYTNIAIGGGIAAIATGTILFFTGHREQQPMVTANISSESVGIAAIGRF